MAEYIDRDALRKKLKETARQYTALKKLETAQDYWWATTVIDSEPAADVAPVVHGSWAHTDKHLWYKNEDGSVDEWRLDVGFHNGPECEICGKGFCVHCDPDYAESKCEIGHYVCSKCGGASRDGREKYCPHCGARMDGGDTDG